MSHPSSTAATTSSSATTAAHGHVLSADCLLHVDVTTAELVVALKSVIKNYRYIGTIFIRT